MPSFLFSENNFNGFALPSPSPLIDKSLWSMVSLK
jgi:hypothetical protein